MNDPDRWRALNESERECLRAIWAFRLTHEKSAEGGEIDAAFEFPQVLMLWMVGRIRDKAPKYPPVPQAEIQVHKLGGGPPNAPPMVTIPIGAIVEGLERMGFLVVPPEQGEAREVPLTEIEA